MEGKKPAGARSRQAMAALAGTDLNGSAGISEATPHAHKEGFLTKQGHFRKTWKRRWFVLEYPHLRYFKNRGDTEQAGEVDCTGVTLSDTASTKTGRDFCFGIFHKDREPYFLQAESQEEMMEWVAAIRHDDSVGMIDFDQLKVLGEGAYGEVFLVRHRTTGTKLAMKVLSKAAMVEHGAVENTKTEREILLRVRHPFVVQMHYAFQTAEKLFMVMDYVNAGDLYSHMCSKKRFSEKVMKIWIAEIALAVGYLHEVGVVFRDLKPENVLLDERGHAHLTVRPPPLPAARPAAPRAQRSVRPCAGFWAVQDGRELGRQADDVLRHAVLPRAGAHHPRLRRPGPQGLHQGHRLVGRRHPQLRAARGRPAVPRAVGAGGVQGHREQADRVGAGLDEALQPRRERLGRRIPGAEGRLPARLRPG